MTGSDNYSHFKFQCTIYNLKVQSLVKLLILCKSSTETVFVANVVFFNFFINIFSARPVGSEILSRNQTLPLTLL